MIKKTSLKTSSPEVSNPALARNPWLYLNGGTKAQLNGWMLWGNTPKVANMRMPSIRCHRDSQVKYTAFPIPVPGLWRLSAGFWLEFRNSSFGDLFLGPVVPFSVASQTGAGKDFRYRDTQFVTLMGHRFQGPTDYRSLHIAFISCALLFTINRDEIEDDNVEVILTSSIDIDKNGTTTDFGDVWVQNENGPLQPGQTQFATASFLSLELLSPVEQGFEVDACKS